ncbi:MAG: tRNA pseudouridine(55) synthase TruB [Holophagaceae bacterium]|nr:tRNA pseudouridine(55) synthase TruB [Holophagaceae bacterium]
MESGVYLVHKDVGGTSFDVVRAFTREARDAGQKKYPLGHGGTLDPFARGLLLVLAGQATRLMELMHPIPKTYVADIAWGVETDTCDHLGQVMTEGDASSLSPAMLDDALATFLGWQDQVPPATSAKKIDGEAAYRKAHRGEEVILPPSRVYLHGAKWLEHDLPTRSRLELTCRGGYYVRALARDLGRQLKCGAHLSGLHRSAIGPWTDPGPGTRIWVHGEALVPWCPSRRLNNEEAAYLDHGRAIPLGELETPTWQLPTGFPDPSAPIRALHEGRLVALLREQEGELRTFANLRGGL